MPVATDQPSFLKTDFIAVSSVGDTMISLSNIKNKQTKFHNSINFYIFCCVIGACISHS